MLKCTVRSFKKKIRRVPRATFSGHRVCEYFDIGFSATVLKHVMEFVLNTTVM